ncbi:MAG: RidA family protein [Candidatus Velamenicoccus archaeovorus]
MGRATLDHPYSVVRIATAGVSAYVSGTLPTDGSGNVVHERDGAIAQMFANLATRLSAEGFTLADVVKTTVYVTDISWRDALNQAYLDTFPEPLPTRTMVEVRALPYGAPIEIEAIVHRPDPA